MSEERKKPYYPGRFKAEVLSLIETRGLTTADVARKMGVLPQNFMTTLSGRYSPTIPTIRKIVWAVQSLCAEKKQPGIRMPDIRRILEAAYDDAEEKFERENGL